MKKLLSVVLALLMLAVMLPVTAMADEAPAGYTENGNSVSISDEGGLKWFAKQVNTGNTYEGKTVTLTNDVTVSDWIPIGQKKNENNRFKGTFDGNGKTVTINSIGNLEDGFGGYAAFFGGTTGATIKNLTVAGTINGANVAGIVARADGGLIENCHNKATITGTIKAAGIAVINKAGTLTIKNCTNEGEIKSTGDRTGGIINLIEAAATIENCTNSGSVTSEATLTYGAGGVVGWIAADNYSIANCKNTAAVSGKGAAGGIVGGIGGIGTVSNCANTGDVTISASAGKENEHNNIGGVAGYIKDSGLTATTNSNSGPLTGTCTRRYIAEDVTLSDSSYPQLIISKGAIVNITAGNLENMVTNYGTLTVKTQVGASGAEGNNTQFHNYGNATISGTMAAGSIHSHEGANTVFDGGNYHFTCITGMRNGLKFVAGTFNDLRKDNGQAQWTDEEFMTYVAEDSTASKEGHVWTVTKNATPPDDGPSTIVIITPAGDTPKTEDQKNPSTGANDMVAAAAALMAVSALGMAVLSRKK